MQKKLKPILSVILLLLLICSVTEVYATDAITMLAEDGIRVATGDWQDPLTNPDTYKPNPNRESDNTKLIGIGNIIIGGIQAIGVAIMVITLMVIGIRYMMGSAQDKASYKETMIPYIIGAVMLGTISAIVGIIYNLVTAIQI